MSGRFNPQDYVTVAQRLAKAREDIHIVTVEAPKLLTDTMGFVRARIELKDGRSAVGTASFRLDLEGKSAQATNPIEDAETSAVGRALAFLGYLASRIASREELAEAERRR